MKKTAGWAPMASTVLALIGCVILANEKWPRSGIAALGPVLLTSAAMGGLIISRRPENAIGWLLGAVAFFPAAGILATLYADHALVTGDGSLPFGYVAAWLQSWLFIPVIASVPLIVTTFPTGRPPSKRWRIVVVLASAFVLFGIFSVTFRPGPYDTFPKLRNPLGVEALKTVMKLINTATGPIVLVTFLLAIISLVFRFRSAPSAQRKQLKWFLQTVLTALAFVLVNPVYFLLLAPRQNAPTWAVSIFGFLIPLVGFTLIPVGIAVAILRYRAFDIDRLMSRTIAYAVMTATLAGTFALLVLVPTALLGAGSTTPSWVVAAATLAVAVLFQPLRRRVQRAVDHRFNRARYDAVRTIDDFAARLRDEIDLETLQREIGTVVARTMQPASVSVWLRGAS